MTLSNEDKRYMEIALRAHGIKSTEGLKIALAPRDDGTVDCVLIPSGWVMAHYTLEGGETVEELAIALGDLLEGSDVRAPSVY